MNNIRFRYAAICALIFALTDLGINLLAALIQQRTPAEQFSQFSFSLLLVLILVGILLGAWLSSSTTLPPSIAENSEPSTQSHIIDQPISITHLQALFTYIKLRGRGIQLSNVLSFGSVIDIDSRD